MEGRALTKRIALIDGHTDPDERRFCHALANAYCVGAESAGHSVLRLRLTDVEIPFLRARSEWEEGAPNEFIQQCQQAIAWAEHIVIIYPLWLGSLPALLQAFLEQTFRPGFAIAKGKRTLWPGLLKGKSARIVVTMGMPSLFYRLYFRAHSLKTLKRNILGFAGISPIRETLIGSVESGGEARHTKIIDQMTALGVRGE
jgi:putative NADPH-quinone reductase